MEETTLFCDLCTSETGVLWTWFTPNVVATLEEAKAQDVPWFQDEEWALCDTCHRLVLAGKRESVFDRAMNTHKGMLLLHIVDGEAQRIDPEPHIRQSHGAFWTYKNDKFERAI